MASKTKTGSKDSADKGKKKAPAAAPVKDKRANFIRLAQGRANAAVKAIQLIGNLSNTNDYEFKDSDLVKILDPIKEELNATAARFDAAKRKIARQQIRLED